MAIFAVHHDRYNDECMCFFCVQALVLSPTRELARQTRTVIVALGDYMEISAYLVVGGESVPEMKARLSSGVHVAIGEWQVSFK